GVIRLGASLDRFEWKLASDLRQSRPSHRLQPRKHSIEIQMQLAHEQLQNAPDTLHAMSPPEAAPFQTRTDSNHSTFTPSRPVAFLATSSDGLMMPIRFACRAHCR